MVLGALWTLFRAGNKNGQQPTHVFCFTAAVFLLLAINNTEINSKIIELLSSKMTYRRKTFLSSGNRVAALKGAAT